MLEEVIKAQVLVETSIMFWGMYVISALIIVAILTGGIFKD